MADRWNIAERKSAENPAVDRFLADIVSVCERHGMSLSHEDKGGCFIVEAFKQENVAYLNCAYDGTGVASVAVANEAGQACEQSLRMTEKGTIRAIRNIEGCQLLRNGEPVSVGDVVYPGEALTIEPPPPPDKPIYLTIEHEETIPDFFMYRKKECA